MVDRIDLLIAVIGIVATIVGSSAPLWMALSKKADKDDLTRLEARMDAMFEALEARFDAKVDGVETRLGASLARVEGKLDALILRLVPEQLRGPGEPGAGSD
jgi:hypothetical protein